MRNRLYLRRNTIAAGLDLCGIAAVSWPHPTLNVFGCGLAQPVPAPTRDSSAALSMFCWLLGLAEARLFHEVMAERVERPVADRLRRVHHRGEVPAIRVGCDRFDEFRRQVGLGNG